MKFWSTYTTVGIKNAPVTLEFNINDIYMSNHYKNTPFTEIKCSHDFKGQLDKPWLETDS